MKCRTFACLFLSLLPIFLYAETEIKLPDTLEKRLGKVRHDTVRVNILNEAAHVYLMNNPDLGRRAAQLALEIASKNNYTLGQHEAMLLLGDYYFYTGNYTEARNCYLQCLDFSMGLNSLKIAKIYSRLSNISLMGKNLDTAIYYAKINKTLNKKYGSWFDYIRSMQNLGLLYFQNRMYDSAIQEFAKAISISDEMIKNQEPQSPEYYRLLEQNADLHRLLALGWQNKGRFKLALQEMQRGITLAIMCNNTQLQASLYSDMSQILQKQGIYEKALEYLIKAVKIYEKLGEKLMIANAYQTIGKIYIENSDYINAYRFFKNSLQVHKSLDNKAGLATIYNDFGNLKRIFNETDSAEFYYKKSLEINKLLSNKQEMGINYLNLGILSEERGKHSHARIYLEEAKKIFEQIDDEENLARVLLEQGLLEANQNHTSLAIDLLLKAEKMASNYGMIPIRKSAAKYLSDIYERTGDYFKAFQYQKLYSILSDTLNNIERQKQILSIQATYDFEKQQNELLLEQEKRKTLEKNQTLQRVISISSLLALILTGLITYLIFKRIKEKQKIEAEKLLKEAEISKAKETLIETQLRNQDLEKQRLIEELKYKSNHLTNLALIIAQKNEFINELKNLLKELKNSNESQKDKVMKELWQKTTQQGNINKELDKFKKEIDDANRSFYEKLNNICPQLTLHEKELAGLLRINLSSKEIASLHNVSVKAIEMSRYRLRKKLQLESNDKLVDFLQKLD
ncbi:MAG TPA: tetratricopeptide repeat protein [Bacteroidales bacterium]|jgi:tetratricopeptide (TPR) repeat protein/DNA-binding CsgD family transcriptional regulator|nr:MAG: Tetratricopeptide repeat protein [Bacteroidetes bacterium ADurb.Bin012]HNQ60558.1 tetratricopeptide repeat protein [Bacteroidales bacterium]HNU22322.1 tetratricopeptide repeat protein [Bacteroidales bacterium]HNV17776.1 tetratricopeptide repeat protein [Bacteroidales bacterium]HNZ78805.1 tetratricopeptide repeat protein [Bacteroidales bacterium]